MIPTAQWMKAFFKTLAKEHEGIIGPRLSLNTLTAYVTRFATAYKREFNWKISESIVKEVKDVTTADLLFICY